MHERLIIKKKENILLIAEMKKQSNCTWIL